MQNLLLKYFWALFIAVTLLDLKISWGKVNRKYPEDQEKTDLGRKIWKGFAVISLLPWVVMGVSVLAGRLPSVLSFLTVWPFNPWIWLFLLTTAGCYLTGAYWLFFRNGAEILMDFNGIFLRKVKSAKMIKITYLLSGAGAIIGFILLGYWQGNRVCNL